MEELEKLKNLVGELGVKIEKENKNSLLLNFKDKNILIRISNVKPKKSDQKIIVISPFVARRIDKEALEKILESDLTFVNKNSLQKFYPSDFIKVVNYLKENPNSYLKKISRELKIHPEKVRRILLRLKDYVEIKTFEGKNLPRLPKLITLRKDLDEEKIKEIAKEKIEIVSSKKKKKRIKYQKISKEEALPMILKFIEENPGVHLREISRKLKINPAIVHFCLKEVSDFIEINSPIGSEDFELPNLPISIKIKDGYTAEGILRVLKIKKILRS